MRTVEYFHRKKIEIRNRYNLRFLSKIGVPLLVHIINIDDLNDINNNKIRNKNLKTCTVNSD